MATNELTTWQHDVESGLATLLTQYMVDGYVTSAHISGTPQRFTKALAEMFSGIGEHPIDALNTLFPTDGNNEMIHVKEMSFYSTCSHHLMPFLGKMSFAYIPDKHIVGLSKIPRLVEVFARRPQVQEVLTTQIVEAFNLVVKPKGCALMVRAYHMCCSARGIKQPTSYMETTAIRGCFTDPAIKSEFITSANASNWRVF